MKLEALHLLPLSLVLLLPGCDLKTPDVRLHGDERTPYERTLNCLKHGCNPRTMADPDVPEADYKGVDIRW